MLDSRISIWFKHLRQLGQALCRKEVEDAVSRHNFGGHQSPVYREYDLVRTDDGWKIANALWHFTNSA